MRLKKIIIKNFRGYCGEHLIDVSDGITALVGKNDAGKSTLLDALEIFYGESKPEIGDLNIYAQDREMILGAIFSEMPDSVSVDSTAETNLQDEYLLNEDGDFEVVVKYTCTALNVSTKSETTIRCLHPTAKAYDDLLTLKLADLKNRGNQLGAKASDERVNNLWRKAIWSTASNLDIKKQQLKVDDLETKARAIYTNVSALFPQYFLFRVDRQTSDGDSEAKDPMQLAVKEAQKEFQDDIQILQAKIQKRVDEVAARALVKLHEMDPTLASKLSPILKSSPKWTFDYRINDDRGISLNKRGSGTRRLVLLNFFRAEAERKSSSGSGSIVYAIEEPETSQHPNNQNMIIDSLLELSRDDKRQVIITSHSPQLVERLPHESVKYIEFDESAKNTCIHEGEGGLIKAANSLGIHAKQKFGSAEGVVLVEGETDELFLKHSAEILKNSGNLEEDFSSSKITILPVGGCENVLFWVQKVRLDELGLPYAIFVDSDRLAATDPETKNEEMVRNLRMAGKVALTTRKREIENYIDPANTNGAIYDAFDDAKLAIGVSDGLLYRGKPRKVFETHWPRMTSVQIIAESEYKDSSGDKRCEIIDIVKEIIGILE